MGSRPEELRDRTKRSALRVIVLTRSLPASEDGRVIARQLLRSATSIASNYRAACRARSKAEFTAKVGVVVEEADETVFWLELLTDSGLIAQSRLRDLQAEANELLAIFAASHRTARKIKRQWPDGPMPH